MEAYRASGMLGRSWQLFKQADSSYSCGVQGAVVCRLDGSTPSYSTSKRRVAWRAHLLRVAAYAEEARERRAEVRKLERRRGLLSLLVFEGKGQRCSPDGCELAVAEGAGL